MKKSKILIFTFLFTFVALLFCGLKVNATTPSTSDLIKVQGAQVRTVGSAGIRFVGTVDPSYDKSNVTAYGISIAFGEANVDQIVVGGIVNEKSVLSAQVSTLDGNYYYINLTNIPATMYAQKVTARSYVVDNGEIVYGDTATSRTLGQVALAVKSAGQTSDLIEEVLTTLQSNYKSSYTDSEGNVYVSSSIYEMNPAKLEAEFVKDWNAKFGTTWTEVTYTELRASAIEGTTALSADTDENCSGTNMYAFFIGDETTSAKWKWLINYMIGVAGGKVHPVRQANALLNSGTYTDSYGSQLWTFKHLSASLVNFFKGGNTANRDAQNDVYFTDPSKYLKVVDYNETILANNPQLICKDNTVELPDLSSEAGYEFAGYKVGEEVHAGAYTVTTDSVVLVPYFTPVSYMVKYYDNNGNVIDELTSYYTVESDDIVLPSYSKAGYAFKGWYTSSSFDAGTETTKIAAGSTGNKEFFAKMEETDKVEIDVTLNPNGGAWDKELVLENANILAKASLTRYLSYDSGGSQAGLHNAKPATWWTYIALSATSYADTYEITQIANKSDGVTVSYDYVIMWHSNLTDATSKSVLNSIASNSATYVGKYVIFENLPSATSTSCNITMNVVDASEFTKAITKSYTNSETLPVPTKENDPFVGWRSSVDGQVVTSYPGYSVDPGDVTYEAVYESEYSEYSNVTVTFNTNGGTMSASSGSFAVGCYDNGGLAYAIYMCDTGVLTSNSLRYQWKLLLTYDSSVDAYKVVLADAATVSAKSTSVTWEYAISSGNGGIDVTKYASVGNYIKIDKTTLKGGTAQTAYVYKDKAALQGASTTVTYSDPTSLPTPTKSGFNFVGWRSSFDNALYLSYPGFKGITSMTLTAEWEAVSGDYTGLMIGSFDTQSWVVAGKTIQLSNSYSNANVTQFKWTSETPSVASVTSTGTVKGLSEGTAIIKVSDPNNSSIYFRFYVTVFGETPTGLLALIAESNNASPYWIENLVIGSASDAASGGQWGYYADLILGSVSQLFYGEDFTIHNDYLHADSDTYGTFASVGTTVDFVTFHYGADTPYAASAVLNGGKNLASYGKTASNLSYHFGTGNDGAWASFNEAYTTYHAGSGSAKTYWYASGVYVKSTDPKYPVTTLGSDGYFYINGQKTSRNNTVKSGAKLSESGFATKVVNGQYYLPNFRYDSTYARLCTSGGNQNSIAIESSVRNGSDLWLTWHYSAQLCAYLLNKYDLEMTRLVTHNFWSGKWCPQPMLENDLEIWYIFRDMVEKELERRQSFNGAALSLSSNSSYIKSNGRISSRPTYSQCVTYDVTYTYGGETKTVTLSTILPGSTR